jgi:hypothetical protein
MAPLNEGAGVKRWFRLTFNRVGLGPNMYELQPAFRVTNGSYCFTSEEAWVFNRKRGPFKDTLYSGAFRKTSIDSIVSILSSLRNEKVDVYKLRFTDGAIDYIEIAIPGRKYEFKMNNTSDTTAQKIVRILNSYIPDSTVAIKLMSDG